MQALIRVTKSSPVQVGTGLAVFLLATLMTGDALAQGPESLMGLGELGPWGYILMAGITVAGQVVSAVTSGLKARASDLDAALKAKAEAEAKVRELEVKLLRAELREEFARRPRGESEDPG